MLRPLWLRTLTSKDVLFLAPLAQMHMGLKDSNVPVWQAYEFQKRVDSAGKQIGFQLFTYYRTHSDIATNNEDLAQRIEDFLSHL